jgi:hypothetical protein
MKLCFVSVNGPRETYFVDEPRIIERARKIISSTICACILKYLDQDTMRIIHTKEKRKTAKYWLEIK